MKIKSIHFGRYVSAGNRETRGNLTDKTHELSWAPELRTIRAKNRQTGEVVYVDQSGADWCALEEENDGRPTAPTTDKLAATAPRGKG